MMIQKEEKQQERALKMAKAGTNFANKYQGKVESKLFVETKAT